MSRGPLAALAALLAFLAAAPAGAAGWFQDADLVSPCHGVGTRATCVTRFDTGVASPIIQVTASYATWDWDPDMTSQAGATTVTIYRCLGQDANSCHPFTTAISGDSTSSWDYVPNGAYMVVPSGACAACLFGFTGANN